MNEVEAKKAIQRTGLTGNGYAIMSCEMLIVIVGSLSLKITIQSVLKGDYFSNGCIDCVHLENSIIAAKVTLQNIDITNRQTSNK